MMGGASKSTEDVKLPPRDGVGMEIFVSFALSIGLFSGFVYHNWTAAAYSFLGPAMLLVYVKSRWYDPLVVGPRFYDGLVESGIVLVVFFNSVLLLPGLLISLGFLVSLLFPLLVSTTFCLGFILYIREYPREVLGLTMKGTNNARDWLLMFLVSAIVLGFLRLLLFHGDVVLAQPLSLLQALAYSFLVFALPVGFAEELVFRGVIQPRLVDKSHSRVIGMSMTALLFSAGHVFSVLASADSLQLNFTSALFVAIMNRLPLSVLLCIVWDMTHSLLASVSVHVTNNTIAYLLLAASYIGV
jgi:membrane protease YdiL (CAAX protease family)